MRNGGSPEKLDYWVTGSNQTLLSKHIQESLAGRAEYFDLNTREVKGEVLGRYSRFYGIEEIDNEGYELENVNVDRSIQQEIQKCTTIDELEDLYKNKNEQQTDKKTFLNLLTQRKEEIIKEQKTQDKKKVENENS